MKIAEDRQIVQWQDSCWEPDYGMPVLSLSERITVTDRHN